jgi:hypothetical protein
MSIRFKNVKNSKPDSDSDDDTTYVPRRGALKKASKPTPSWSDCCDELGIRFASKGSQEYNEVRELFDSYRNAGLSEDEIRSKEVWKKACAFYKYPFVKKGTPQYDRVLKMFKKMIAPEVPVREPNSPLGISLNELEKSNSA